MVFLKECWVNSNKGNKKILFFREGSIPLLMHTDSAYVKKPVAFWVFHHSTETGVKGQPKHLTPYHHTKQGDVQQFPTQHLIKVCPVHGITFVSHWHGLHSKEYPFIPQEGSQNRYCLQKSIPALWWNIRAAELYRLQSRSQRAPKSLVGSQCNSQSLHPCNMLTPIT